MFVVKRSHHNPILTPDKDHYWEAFATFNMSVIKKGKTFYGVYRAIGASDVLRTPNQISIIGLGISKDKTHFEDCAPFITGEDEWEKYPQEEEDKKWREQWIKNWKKEPKISSPAQKAEQTYNNIKEFLLGMIG